MSSLFNKQAYGKNRVVAAMAMVASASILGVAMYLTPAVQGLGTHQQLGLPACGFYAGVGMPCATCGMTTAFSYAAHGDLLGSFVIQPAGAVMVVLTACLFIVSAWSVISGMSLMPIGRWLWTPKFVIYMSVLVVASWGYKIVMVTGW